MTLEKPPTTLGENQSWELLLISGKCFLQWEKYSEKSASTDLQLISFSVLNHHLGKCANSNKCCTASSIFVPKKQQTAPRKVCQNLLYGLLGNVSKDSCTIYRKSCQNCLGMCAKIYCTNLLKYCLGMCAKLLPPLHCPEISLALFLSSSQSAHERMNDLFLL